MKHIVSSRDNIQFVVESDSRSIQFDQAYALVRTSEELSQNSDFIRINSLDDVGGPLSPEKPSLTDRKAAFRAKFRVVQGGRS